MVTSTNDNKSVLSYTTRKINILQGVGEVSGWDKRHVSCKRKNSATYLDRTDVNIPYKRLYKSATWQILLEKCMFSFISKLVETLLLVLNLPSKAFLFLRAPFCSLNIHFGMSCILSALSDICKQLLCRVTLTYTISKSLVLCGVHQNNRRVIFSFNFK